MKVSDVDACRDQVFSPSNCGWKRTPCKHVLQEYIDTKATTPLPFSMWGLSLFRAKQGNACLDWLPAIGHPNPQLPGGGPLMLDSEPESTIPGKTPDCHIPA